jgi:chemotaxis protein MotB
MRRIACIIFVVILGALLTMGCSNKKLIAQKDQQIASLQEEITSLEGQLANQRQMNDDLSDMLSQYQEKEKVWLEEKEGMTQITLDGSATFPVASAKLSKEGKDIIDLIWKVLKDYPSRFILIEGHTDNQQLHPVMHHVYRSNWELSSARAHAVLHYAREKFGTPPERIRAVGCGEFQPIADNNTDLGREKNRRVVITIGTKMKKVSVTNRPES